MFLSDVKVALILLIVLYSVQLKAPDGLPSGIPPEMADWLEFGLRPPQIEALLEAEQRRLERALAREQLTEAEIEELEKAGAFTSRSTAQDVEKNLLDFNEKLKNDFHNYYQGHVITVKQFNALLNRMKEIRKSEAGKTLEELTKLRQDLNPELKILYNEGLKIRQDLDAQIIQVKNIISSAEEFFRSIPPYPELGDVRSQARTMLDYIRNFYSSEFSQERLKVINGILDTITKSLEQF